MKLSENSFIHISYLDTDDYGKVACNGYVYLKNGEALVVDTPTNDLASEALLEWISETKKHSLRAVVINHFHKDCLGGLQHFHDLGVASYAYERTITLARASGATVPKHSFSESLSLNIGGTAVENRFFGPAHTEDNSITYLEEESLLYGGCMVKSIDATKGFLGDANVNEWSNTISKIKHAYPNLKTVIPGHGEAGGIELLAYTEKLFSIKN